MIVHLKHWTRMEPDSPWPLRLIAATSPSYLSNILKYRHLESLRCQEQVSFIVRPLFDVYEVCPGVQKNTEEVAVLFSVGSETAWSGDCGYRSHARHKLIIKENE